MQSQYRPVSKGQGSKIFVGNLPFDTHDREVHRFFDTHNCEVEDVNLQQDEMGNMKGCGFITFKTEQDLESALKLDGQSFLSSGRNLRKNKAEW